MAGLIARGQAVLAARQKVAAATDGTLTYHRAADDATVDLTGKAWVGRTPFRVSDSTEEARIIWSDRDYLIPVADLGSEPARGDWLEEVLPGGTVRFEVTPYANEPEWRYSDPQQTVYRVHCKRVEHAG